MIDFIDFTYGNKEYSIKFENNLARRIYGIDSVNLLLGENGTGKTTILREIVKDLLGGAPEFPVYVAGENSIMGVVYFTPVPFVKEFVIPKNCNIHFYDASKHASGDGGFEIGLPLIKDIKKVFDSFGVSRSVSVGVSSFNCIDIIFRAMQKVAREHVRKKNLDVLVDVNQGRGYGLLNIMVDFIRYEKLVKEYQELRDYIRKSETSLIGVEVNTAERKNLLKDKSKLSKLNLMRQSLVRHLRERIEEYFRRADHVFGHWYESDDVVYFDEDRFDVVALLSLSVDTRSAEETQSILFSSGRLDKNVELMREFLKEWDFEEALTIKYHDYSIVDVKFDFIKSERRLGDTRFNYYYKNGLVSFGFGQLSSGEEVILRQCLALEVAVRNLKEKGVRNLFVIIDEGDMLLHLKWQRSYIKNICSILSGVMSSGSVQLLVATHSAILASDVVKSAITCLGDNQPETIKAFGAPISSIYNGAFDTLPVGSIAEYVIREMSDRKSNLSDSDVSLIRLIDDKFVREYFEVYD